MDRGPAVNAARDAVLMASQWCPCCEGTGTVNEQECRTCSRVLAVSKYISRLLWELEEAERRVAEAEAKLKAHGRPSGPDGDIETVEEELGDPIQER